MIEGKESGYQPSEEEIKDAEAHMTEKEAVMSEAREEVHGHYKDGYRKLSEVEKLINNDERGIFSVGDTTIREAIKKGTSYVECGTEDGKREVEMFNKLIATREYPGHFELQVVQSPGLNVKRIIVKYHRTPDSF